MYSLAASDNAESADSGRTKSRICVIRPDSSTVMT
jgi:hypothetical protein